MNYLGVLACIAPLYLIVYTYKNDRTTKEPIGLIIKLFILGALSVIPIIVVEEALTYLGDYLNISSYLVYNLFDGFIIAGMSEESFKYIFLKLGSWKHKSFDTSYDGIIYAVTVSMGFAIVENITYCIGDSLSTVLMRSLLSIPGHCAFGVVMGIFYARAKLFYDYGRMEEYHLDQRKAIIYPMLFHGLYDFCLMQGGEFMLVFVVVMILVYRQLFRNIKIMSNEDRSI